MKFQFWAMAAQGQGISGGDRIFIELARRWQKTHQLTVFVGEEGLQMCQRQSLKPSNKLNFEIVPVKTAFEHGFFVGYFYTILRSVSTGIKTALSLHKSGQTEIIIYSASEFWMDSLPALIIKLFNQKVKWIAAWYQTAPPPWIGFSQGQGRSSTYKISALYYWLMQLPIRPLIDKFADLVLVNNGDEKKSFPKLCSKGRVQVVLGAVNTKEIELWQKQQTKPWPKIYDGVFQGRFHPQKGVVELIEIWQLVVENKPDAKLVMIGDGPLMAKVKEKIHEYKLEKNVVLLGYLFDGPKKYQTFSQSRVVLHPAFFDSGGMASAEAMAFSLPCVGFDLPSYKYYYPTGMLKVPTGDLRAFTDAVIKLLNDTDLYKQTSQAATKMINSKWSWDYRASQVLDYVRDIL